jgi:hypothetical protein
LEVTPEHPGYVNMEVRSGECDYAMKVASGWVNSWSD